MKFLILLQILITTVQICRPEDEPNTTVIVHDTRTEMTVEQVNNMSRSKTNEFFESLRESKDDGNDLDFDYDDENDEYLKTDVKDTEVKEQEMQEVLLKAMKKPAIRKQIGEVIPILRVMSPAQRLTLAALVSSQIMSQATLSENNLAEIASMFAGKTIENADDRHNITEHLLLPISMDIAKMFKGLGREVGRNLRDNFNRPRNPNLNGNKFRRLRKPVHRTTTVPNRRMDEEYSFDYEYEDEPKPTQGKPKAESLRQPGKDECDYFTKNLCLEVPNYPAEAIILSLKSNKEIAKTFLTDFKVEIEEKPNNEKNNPKARRFQRRQDGQNVIQEFNSPEGGYMCPSSVKYARPKRARTTSGQWKYIVNAGDYTQTLRLEICLKPKSACSFVNNHLSSQCTQVFNYHRLLTWDEGKGLHMDIFKVPSCCSCHIQGYQTYYPPGDNAYTFADKRREPIEANDFSLEAPGILSFESIGNKREVLKPIPLPSTPITIVKTQQQLQSNIEEFFPDPVEHLVPPGPPLPLNEELNFNQPPDLNFYQKRVQLDHNRLPPLISIPTEPSRTVNKPTERIEIEEPVGELTQATKERLKPQYPQQRPSLVLSQPHPPQLHPPQSHPPQLHPPQPLPALLSPPKETNPIFEAANQIRYIGSFASTPPPYTGSEIILPQNQGLFITQNNNDLIGSKPNSPIKIFNPEFNDVKSLPSRVSTLYVTPPKIQEVHIRPTTTSTTTTTRKPPIRSESISPSGHKKINYNYHPIIDFFQTDIKKRHTSFSPPKYLPLSSQEWTPVIGH